MADNTKSCIAFVSVVGIACLLAWLAGFNFDHRGDDVFIASAFTLGVALFAAAFVRSEFP